VETYLLSVGTALPGPALDNTALAALFQVGDAWEEWVNRFIGTRTRHLSVDLDSGEVTAWLADLGTEAGGRALTAAALDPAEVDLIILATSSPDQLMPATVNVIADRLGIDGVPTFQLQSGCSGAVQALDVARQMLLTGRHHRALVIGGDVTAKQYDLTVDPARIPQADMVNAVLFGDGAGAAVLSTAPRAGSPVVREVRVRLAGRGRAPGHQVDWFGVADRASGRPGTSEDYHAVEALVPVLAGELLKELLADLDWKAADLDYLLPPQLSGRMTAEIVRSLAVPDTVEVSCVRDTGNTGNALPFFQLERLLPAMTPGQRAVAVAIESSKWIKSGFAVEQPTR
jgi:3-oxoacyl-[acyl-carrier-protein] synthase-3